MLSTSVVATNTCVEVYEATRMNEASPLLYERVWLTFVAATLRGGHNNAASLFC